MSQPPSDVFIDGVAHGEVRVSAQLPLGTHAVLLVPRDPAFTPYEREFTLSADAPYRFCWDFTASAVCTGR